MDIEPIVGDQVLRNVGITAPDLNKDFVLTLGVDTSIAGGNTLIHRTVLGKAGEILVKICNTLRLTTLKTKRTETRLSYQQMRGGHEFQRAARMVCW